MDTSAYLMELAQKFQINSFDGDLSGLNSSDSSAASNFSSDASSGEISDANLLDTREQSGLGADISLGSPAPATSSSSIPPGKRAAAASSSNADKKLREEELKVKYDQTKKNLRKQNEELERTTKQLDELKHRNSRERSEYEDRIRTLEHNHSMLESQYQKSMLEFNHTLTVKQNELNTAQSGLRAAQLQLQESNPDILKQIEYVKDDLTDIVISEPLYLEYKAIEPHRQTIREYVACNVHELLRSERAAKESMSKELEMIREKFIKSEDEADRNAREKDQIAKLKRCREAEMQSELQHYETLNAKLHDELTKKTLLVQELTSKGEMYDALRAKAEKLEQDLSEVQQKDLLNSLTNRSLTEEREQSNSKLFQLEKQQDLLRMDKMYLTKEVERLTECYRNGEKDKERYEIKQLEWKKQKEELVEKLIKVREEHQASYQEKLNNEINRLQTRTTADLESIRLNQREAYEREIKGLKESKDNLVMEHEKLHAQHERVKEDLVNLQETHRNLLSQLETERTDTRNALKLKSFEYERLSLTYEESLSDHRKLKIEHEVQAKKLSVLKNEFYTLQGDSQKRILELESETKNLHEKLTMYQQLEYELDMAILNAGGADPETESPQKHGNIRGIHSMLETIGSNVPTANKRRIKQSILLAQQVVEKSKQIQVLEKELSYFKDQHKLTEMELNSAKQNLEMVAQPHNYLIQTLQSKEKEMIELSKRSMDLSRELATREEELKRSLSVQTQLESDVHRLLNQKQTMEELKTTLLRQQGGGGVANLMLSTNAKPAYLDNQAAMQQIKENLHPRSVNQAASPRASWNDPKQRFYNDAAVLQRPHAAGPTSSLAALSSSQGRGGDSNLDEQPKPLWFRKLNR